ncbi:MAG: hypothetical protein PHY45_06915 [Rhodocyclaceae bacterium]|nr:hypothetical protein [Rhodocyclaceae bacterium]
MDSLNLDMALAALHAFLVQVGAFLPTLLLAAIIAGGGWLVAKALRLAVVKSLAAMNFHVLTQRAGIDDLLLQAGVKTDTAGILGLLAFWLAFLAALILAFNSLGLAYVTEMLGRVAMIVPRLMLAVLIVAYGAYFARFIEGKVRNFGRDVDLADADLLGRLARYALLLFVVLIALDQMDIGGGIIRQSFLILLSGVVLALALAFGLGGRDWAAALLERWWPRKGGAATPPRKPEA